MKTLVRISIPSIALFVAGAWSLNLDSETSSTVQTDPLPATAQTTVSPEKTPEIWAVKTSLYRGETLSLRFAAPNPTFLGVVDPSGHFFYVVFPADAASGQLKPFVDSARFESLNNLDINTRTFKADPYQYGVYANQKVFTQSGTYTFIMGDNLHVDDPAFVDKVEIHYAHESRPAIAMQ